MNAKNDISRRDFLKTLAMAGVSISSLAGCFAGKQAFDSHLASPAPADGKSTVVIVRSESLANPDKAGIKKMLDVAVPQALGVASAEAAWAMLYKPNDTVGIKVNCIAPRLASHPELALAIADSLIAAGVPADQIIIWDRDDRELEASGYVINAENPGVKCYGTKPRWGYSRELTANSSVGVRFSNIISRQCTAMVNVPVIKDHNIAGLSLSLKNYFGAIESPNKFHGNNCNPYVADVYSLPHVRKKSRLVIVDAISVLYEGGPTNVRSRYVWNYNGLLIGTDPVAVDQIGLMLLEDKRSAEGLPSLGSIGREAKYIATAADSDHNLGVNDPRHIRVVEIPESTLSQKGSA